MCINFRRNVPGSFSTAINDQAVETVESFKYLSAILHKLPFEQNTNMQFKKSQHLFSVRRLAKFL